MGVIRSKESEIDEIAKSVLQDLLPPAWVRNTHRQDYAIDSTVELCEARGNGPKEVTGIEFLIQLKGKEKPRIRKGSISVRLDRVDLEYYVDRKRLPVFLVVVDTKVREGYWLFLQGYALEKQLPRHWRQQKTVTVRVDMNSKLRNTQAFTEAIKEADQQMSLLRPGSLQAALAAEKAKLEALDPRFEAVVSTKGADVHFELNPRCEIHGTLRFEGPAENVKRCFADFMDRGLPVRPQEYGVALKAQGSPLMEREDISEISCTRSNDGSIRITHIRGDGTTGATLEIQGQFKGGDAENRFEPTIEPTTFSISVTSGCKPDGGVRCAFNVKYDLKPWLGKPVMLLEYFDQLYEVFGSMDENSSMKIDLFIKGNRLGGGVVSSEEIAQLGPYVGTLYWIDKLRAVERILKSGLVIPDLLPDDWAADVDFAHQLVIGGVVETKLTKLDFTAEMPRESYEQCVSTSVGVVDTFRMNLPEFKRDLLGRSIDLGPVELIAPGTRLSVVTVEKSSSSPNKVTVQCQAEIDGPVTIRRRDET